MLAARERLEWLRRLSAFPSTARNMMRAIHDSFGMGDT